MAQGVGIEEVIDIETSISSGGVASTDFGSGLLLTVNTTLTPSGANKIRRYNSLTPIKDDFGVNSDVYRDSAIWFASDPSPKSLYIARVNDRDHASRAYSKSLTGTSGAGQSGTDWAKLVALTAAKIKIGGASEITLSLSGSTSWSNLASKIQAAIRSGLTGTYSSTSVTYDSTLQRIVFEFFDSGGAVNTNDIRLSATGPDSTNLPILLGFDDSATEGPNNGSGAYYVIGGLTELVDTALQTAISNSSHGKPTAVMLCSDVPTTVSSVAAIASLRTFAQQGEFIASFTEHPDISGNDLPVNSQLSVNSSSSNSHTVGIYAEDSDSGTSNRRIDIAMLAKLSGQDFNLPQSIITLVPKPLNNVVTSEITSENIDKLEAAKSSIYTTVRGYPSFLGGKVGNGTWVDAQWWLLWLKSEMENNIFNAMRQSNRLTNIELTDTIHKVMAKAINTGGVKLGGEVNTDMKKEIRIITDNPTFNGVLQNGYLLWVQKGSSLTDLDRSNRHANFKVWVAPSDAIHSVKGTIVLSG